MTLAAPRPWGFAALLAGTTLVSGAYAAPAAPPGHNVHLIQEGETGRFWRGGAPRRDTLEALARAARERGVAVTLVDLRSPPTVDDRSGKSGRLSPSAEASLAKRLGLRYVSISALSRSLLPRLEEARSRGDVYMHCMYGVNRTGFAAARFARKSGAKIDRTALGERDWKQGDRFQARLDAARRP